MTEPGKRRASLGLVAVTSALVLGGCVVKTTSTSFVRNSSSLVEYAYTNPKADFSRYTRLTTDGLEIYFPTNMDAPRPEDVDRIRAAFRTAFLNALGDDYEFVDKAGPDVLKVRAQLVDMKMTGAEGDFIGSGRLSELVSRGELTFIMEMIDSQSGEVLARAGDRTHSTEGREGDAGWADVEEAAAHWAGLFRAWLDRSLGSR